MSNEMTTPSGQRRLLLVALLVFALLAVSAVVFWPRGKGTASDKAVSETKHADEHGEGAADEVKLSAEALAAAGIETAEVTEEAVGARLRVTGTVEANQQQTQQATPLVSGRVERVQVALGDRVSKGSVLAVISSPQIAQLHGKLHEAETKLSLAERELQRVLQAENRAAVLTAKAKLDEADATLKRTRRLIELGAGAGKDLVSAETAHRTAQAEYDFQKNIALNREIQEARAEVETAKVDVAHIRDEMRSLGVEIRANERDSHHEDTSLVRLRAPASGTVTERLVNAGAGIEAGKPLFTVANLSTLWVIANVPEAQVTSLRPGAFAVIRSAALGNESLSGRINYIDPQLNEETRTARVRVEITNPGGRLRTGMFAEIEFMTGAGNTPKEIVIPEAAVQRIGERTVVFVPGEEKGHFKVRDIVAGAERDSLRRVTGGLKPGEKVVTKGSFTLKTQLMKGELGEEH
ncbi:MAG TPA: efflux RND transporter periplasmic adaptor subunit [Blastocatellia bacterium]|nr:efflux RND transporter periplasmic adaptor subunit [Blastocatellia bacterium]